jgi:hypothetical protein
VTVVVVVVVFAVVVGFVVAADFPLLPQPAATSARQHAPMR